MRLYVVLFWGPIQRRPCLQLQSCKVSFVQTSFFSRRIDPIFCTEHGRWDLPPDQVAKRGSYEVSVYNCHIAMGLLTFLYVKLRVAHEPGMPGTLSPPPRVCDPDKHHGTCITRVPWCMPGLLTSGFLRSRWRGKRSRHSRCMRKPQFYVSGKRPMYLVSDPDSLASKLHSF